MRRTRILFLQLTLATYCVAQQPQSFQSIFQAAIASLSSGNLASLQLSGTFESPVGESTDQGSFSAECSISGASQLQLQFSSGSHTESRNSLSGKPAGNWIDEKGQAHQMPQHNLQTPAGLFCPQIALAEILQAPALTIRFRGNETKDGVPSLHFTVQSLGSDMPSPLSSSRDLAQMEIYLDAATLRPVAFRFNAHPDINALVNMPVEFQFESYSDFGGVLVPTKIVKYMNGSRALTLQIASAVPNSSQADAN